LARLRIAEIVAGLRVGARPRDLIGRVRWLLLAYALLNAAGAMVVALAFMPQPPLLALAGLAAPPALAAAWIWAYRRRTFGLAVEVASTAAMCLVATAIDIRWNEQAMALLSAAVFFSAAYGPLRRVLARTALLTAIALGLGLSDRTTLGVAVVSAAVFLLVAWLIHVMTVSIARYEASAHQSQVLAAAGLALVAAPDMAAITASAVESTQALCAGLASVRVSVALADAVGREAGPDTAAHQRLKILAAAGDSTVGWKRKVLEGRQAAPTGQPLAGQHILRRTEDRPAERHAKLPLPPFERGEAVVTGINFEGRTRCLLIVESAEPVPASLPGAIKALAIQVSLAVARADLQKDDLELQSAQRFQALVQASGDVISIVSPDGRIRFQSPSCKQVFGYDPEKRVGAKMTELVHPDDLQRVAADFERAVAEPGSSVVSECRLRHADGSWIYTETRMTNLIDVPAVGGVVLNTRDTTERHTLEAELRHQAFHDSLTGLANRDLFANRIEHALTSSKRDGCTIAVLYCVMDGFGRLNESLGYTTADTALVMVAERLRTCVRGQDTVARLGGNEFGMLLDRLTSPADATMAMERIMATLRQPLALPAASVEMQPQIGIAIAVAGNDTADDLLRNSSLAVRTARVYEGGYALFDPEMHADAIRHLEMESQLREAIEKSQFVLYYQPTIDLQTGRLTGVEALVRWQHPRRGLVPPMEFIPLAEESGLIVELGRWTIQEACRQVREWQKAVPADEPIAINVNLSARQLRHPNIVRDIADVLDDTGLLPSRLILEITESVLMADTSATLNRLFQLKSLGVRLAVDDFGTGYSSFAYLRRFPVDILKIDKSFVDGVATEPTASALVDAMIRIGKTLHLETVAEGVEHVEQADRLRTLQCDIGQGYLFSRPVGADAITAMLRERADHQQASAA
jgi:diguanylate cyclase (GGDEF)-like protein/PAS domain S-box-containing protein